MEMKIDMLNKVTGVVLILLSMVVSIPLTIHTFVTDGGTWGFGMAAIGLLLPLNACLLFGVAALIGKENKRRTFFIFSHAVTVITALTVFLIFPVFHFVVTIAPIAAILGIADKKRFKYYLLVMITLSIIANIILLKWEFDFGRTLPILQLLNMR